MPASSMPEKSQALARALIRLTDADVVEFAEPEAMDSETATTHFAGYLAKRVVRRLLLLNDAQHARRSCAGRLEQYDGTGRLGVLLAHSWIMGAAPNPDNANRRVIGQAFAHVNSPCFRRGHLRSSHSGRLSPPVPRYHREPLEDESPWGISSALGS